jgi:hypothetical protein
VSARRGPGALDVDARTDSSDKLISRDKCRLRVAVRLHLFVDPGRVGLQFVGADVVGLVDALKERGPESRALVGTFDPKESVVDLQPALDELVQWATHDNTPQSDGSRGRRDVNCHRGGGSNVPTEGMKLRAKRIKRSCRGFSCFDHYGPCVLRPTTGITRLRLIPRTRFPSADQTNRCRRQV